MVKLSPAGALLAGTYIGGSDGENPDGIYVDSSGTVFITGETGSSDFPITGRAFQSTNRGGNDAVLVRLSSDLGSRLYSTYMGGGAYDNGRSGFLGQDGCLYVTGATDGPGWPTKQAFQDHFAGGRGGYGNGDCILAKFRPRTGLLNQASGGSLDREQTEEDLPARGAEDTASQTGAVASREGSASLRAPVLDLSVGLVGHWTFDEGRGTRVGDASGNGNDGVLRRMSTSSAWVAGCPPSAPIATPCVSTGKMTTWRCVPAGAWTRRTASPSPAGPS